MLNLVHLNTLGVVVRTGSFADAGRTLGYTSSAVSQQMSTLERKLNARLFVRSAHGIEPTPAALLVAERSLEAMGTLQTLEEDISLIVEGGVGTLRVGSFPSASEQLLPSALSALRKARPGVSIHLDEEEPQGCMSALLARKLDAALVYAYQGAAQRWPSEIGTQRVLREQLFLVTPGDSRSRGEHADLRDHASSTWIATKEGTQGAAALRLYCQQQGYEPDIAYRSNNYEVIQGLVRAGLGIAVVPALAARRPGGTTLQPLSWEQAARDVLIAAPVAGPESLVTPFANSVREAGRRAASSTEGIVLGAPERRAMIHAST